MNRYLKLLMSLLVLISIATSCSESTDIQYVPFRENEDGDWGLVSPKGEVLVNDRFKQMPTMASCDRFFVPNSRGYYELYTTEKSPRRIEGEYRYVSMFYKGKAFAAKRDKPLSVIDKDGNVLIWLEKMKGKKPSSLSDINEGFAVGRVDTVQGLLNTEGEWVIEPKYSFVGPMHHNYAVALDSRFYNLNSILTENGKNFSTEDIKKFPEGFFNVFNKKGERILRVSSHKYQAVNPHIFDKCIAVGRYINNEWRWGIIDMDGNEIVKPSPKYAEITEINGDQFIYKNQDGEYGLSSANGKGTTIKPRYSIMCWANNKILLSGKGDDEESMKYVYLDSEGNPIIGKPFKNATPFLPGARKFAFVAVNETNYTIINRKIERLRDAPHMAVISFNEGNTLLRSDYIDINSLLKAVDFTETTLDSLSFTSTVQTVLARQARYFSSINKPQASDYTNTSQVDIFRDIDGESIQETIFFPTTLSHRTYTTRQVIDYVDYYWGYYYYHNQTVPTGWAFTTESPSRFEIKFSNSGILRGKLRPLMKAVTAKFAKYGSVIEQNNGAALVNLSAGRQALIAIHPTSLTVEWGKLPSSSTYIGQYADVKEDLTDDALNIIEPYPLIYGF